MRQNICQADRSISLSHISQIMSHLFRISFPLRARLARRKHPRRGEVHECASVIKVFYNSQMRQHQNEHKEHEHTSD